MNKVCRLVYGIDVNLLLLIIVMWLCNVNSRISGAAVYRNSLYHFCNFCVSITLFQNSKFIETETEGMVVRRTGVGEWVKSEGEHTH